MAEDYSNDVNGFLTAVAMATSAAVIMPYAWPLVGLMSMLAADPHAQNAGAEEWLNPKSVNVGASGEAAEGKDSGSDIAALRSELKRIGKQIGEDGDWEGRAYQSFKDKIDVLDGHLATLDESRVGTGNTLKATAQGFHVLMQICVIVGGFLEALALFVMTARMTVAGAAPGEAAAMRAVMGLHQSVSTIFKNHWKLVLKATVILGIAGVAYNQFSHDLPGLQAASAKAPNLIEASAIYDPSSVDIVDDPQSQFDTSKMEDPSLMPDFGF
ncbi:hypothetical protein [Nonomuraea insulae]|uniref:ESX-1 secretion-associated protein EspA/EspE-like domain-containing protein n=1 Tax=Nonomuraea insulae TaxID=1616787 RepID=A0ABW1CP52_9ACTN